MRRSDGLTPNFRKLAVEAGREAFLRYLQALERIIRAADVSTQAVAASPTSRPARDKAKPADAVRPGGLGAGFGKEVPG